MPFAMLHRHILALALTAATGSAAVAAASATEDGVCGPDTETRLDVTVTNVRSGDGNVTITLYGDDPDDFLASGTKIVRHRVPAVEGATPDCLALPGPGTYAIAVYHDEDGDRDFGRNLIGMPTEGYGVSNNPKIGLLPPDFEEVKFDVEEGENALSINLKY